MSWVDSIKDFFSRPLGYRTYMVKKGDTLSEIAQDYYGDGSQYMRIYNANRDQLHDPNKIYPGQVLRIP